MAATNKVSATRREARKAARVKNQQKADEQERNLPETAAASKEKAAEKPAPRAPRKSAKETRAEQRKAAERRADAQERSIARPEVDTDIEGYMRRNQPVPLHVLNAKAREADKERRDDARDISKAAGNAAYNAARGKRTIRSKGKFSTIRDAQDALTKSKAAKQDAE